MKYFSILWLVGCLIFNAYTKDTNVVLIIVDDLGYADLSCIGKNKDVSTPNIDKLAKEGTRFTNAYAMAPICNASRISIATGAYHQRQGQYWYSGPGLHRSDFKTIAECLKAKDYITGYIGKFHHGTSDKPSKRGFPLNHGFDSFFGFSGGTKHYLHHSRKYVWGKNLLHQGPMYDGVEQVNIAGFSTELFGQRARSFVEKNKDKKFFLQLSFNSVHNYTHQLPKWYLDKQGLKGFEDMKKGEDYWKWREKISFPANPEGRDYYLGQLYFLDREIGLLMKKLEDLKLRENTAVVFISDNGGSLVTYANNGELSGGKYTLLEGGIRVPMIISFPEVLPENKISESIVSSMDILPTVCAITGVPIPANIDGLNLTEHLTNGEKLKREKLYFDIKYQTAIRKGDWKLLITESTPNRKLQITPTPKGKFLYDLENDPGEKNNLIQKYPEMARQLENDLQEWRKSLTKPGHE